MCPFHSASDPLCSKSNPERFVSRDWCAHTFAILHSDLICHSVPLLGLNSGPRLCAGLCSEADFAAGDILPLWLSSYCWTCCMCFMFQCNPNVKRVDHQRRQDFTPFDIINGAPGYNCTSPMATQVVCVCAGCCRCRLCSR